MSLVKEDVKIIDILGSYIKAEKKVKTYLSDDCVRVDLNGYYAPFLLKNPWTSLLKGKKVLVVHPFTDSIQKQYERREFLFDNPDVLPAFEKLYLVRAVQSMAGNGVNTGFSDWFKALEYMKKRWTHMIMM